MNNGTPIPISTLDSHYKIIADYITGTSLLATTDAFASDILPDNYVTAPANSQWISAHPILLPVDVGWYVFRTTFDLSGFDLSTVRIDGQTSQDNQTRGPGLLINEIDTGYVIGIANGPGQSLTDDNHVRLSPFSISSGFRNGLNTLDWRVFNTGDAMALLVKVEGTGTLVNAVPEPSSFTILALLSALGVNQIRRRRK